MSERTYFVYQHFCTVNSKSYFGVTCQAKPEDRWGSNGSNYSGQYFGKKIKEEGLNWHYDFEHRILAEGLSQKDAFELEKTLIAENNSRNPEYGYNVDAGGIGHLLYTTKEAKAGAVRNKSKRAAIKLKERRANDLELDARLKAATNFNAKQRRLNPEYRTAYNAYASNKQKVLRQKLKLAEDQTQYIQLLEKGRQHSKKYRAFHLEEERERSRQNNKQRRADSTKVQKDLACARNLKAQVKALREELQSIYNKNPMLFNKDMYNILFERGEKGSYKYNSKKVLLEMLNNLGGTL